MDDESPSASRSVSSPSDRLEASGEASRIVGKGSRPSSCLDRIFCRMREGENGVFLLGGGAKNSSTVDLMAVVISAREVYGKQIFRTALYDH